MQSAMNRIFRVIWSEARRTWVAVFEFTRARRKEKSRSRSRTLIGAREAPMPILRRRLFHLVVAAIVSGVPGAAAATDLLWDADGVAPVDGGTGPWNTTSLLWWNGASYQAWNNAAIDDAVFGGASGTVTLASPITIHDLSFIAAVAYTITGSTLTLGGVTPTIDATAGSTVTIASAITGTAGLTTTGPGLLTLSGVNSFSGGLTLNGTGTVTLSNAANTYTGGTTINSGTLRISAANRMPASTDVVIANATGATLNLNGFAQSIASLSGGGTTGGTVTLGAGTLTINKASGSSDFAGVISGTGGLTKSGASTQILSGANSYSGTTTITGGTLQIGNGGTTGTLGTGDVTVTGGA
ncbi:MAG: autotransporter-associated beta strand repeat-containing protein, partial [Steroidobacteraceae bacterium]